MNAEIKQRKSVRNFFLALFLFAVLAGVVLLTLVQCTKASSESVSFQDGDIVLQTSGSGQSLAISIASQSLYTHMGIVQMTSNGPVVIEAAATVMQTPLQAWIDRGRWARLTVLRKSDLSTVKANQIVKNALSYSGRPYDVYFSDGSDRIYCSELVWLAYKDAGLSVGEMQKVKELSLNSAPVQKLIEQRWKNHPFCKSGKAKDFESCWQKIMNGDIITPVSIAKDKQFSTIYSNYY